MTPAASLRNALRRKVKARGGVVRNYKSLSQKGVADCIVFLPGGVILLVEIKAGKDTVKKLQTLEAEAMERLGTQTYFVRTKDDIDQLLENNL